MRCKIISWFALSNKKAEYYRKKMRKATVHAYKVKRNVNLMIANNDWNLKMFSYYARKKASSLVVLTEVHLNQIPMAVQNKFQSYSYLRMTRHERAVHEYKFAFGFLYPAEQLEFIKLCLNCKNMVSYRVWHKCRISRVYFCPTSGCWEVSEHTTMWFDDCPNTKTKKMGSAFPFMTLTKMWPTTCVWHYQTM